MESVTGKDKVSSLELVFVRVFRKTSHGVTRMGEKVFRNLPTNCIEVSAILFTGISFIPSLSTHVTSKKSASQTQGKLKKE